MAGEREDPEGRLHGTRINHALGGFDGHSKFLGFASWVVDLVSGREWSIDQSIFREI